MTAVASSSGIRGSDIVIGLGTLGMVSAQIAIPLTSTSPALSTVTVIGMALVAFGGAWRGWGMRAAAMIGAGVIPAAFAVELLGSRTGFPFGTYEYTGALQPSLAGVPLIVALAWFGMGTAAYATVQWFVPGRTLRIGLGALALTAWDLFLDPQMVKAGFWEWSATDSWTYRGIPWTNFVGWLLAALVVMLVIDRWRGVARSRVLLGLYTWFAVMQTIGFLFFFDDVLVGAVGGCAMLPFVAFAWWRVVHD